MGYAPDSVDGFFIERIVECWKRDPFFIKYWKMLVKKIEGLNV